MSERDTITETTIGNGLRGRFGSDALSVTPTAAKGLIALVLIAGLFGTSRMADRVAQTSADIDLLQRQYADLQRIAAAPDPSVFSDKIDARMAKAGEVFLRENTPGLNAARLQGTIKAVLNDCQARRSLISVEPQDIPEGAGENGPALQPFLASARFRISREHFPDCLLGLAEAQTFLSVDTLTLQGTGTAVMNVRAYAIPPAAPTNGTGS